MHPHELHQRDDDLNNQIHLTMADLHDATLELTAANM
jgi:hypothetical protein